jgi:dihydropyrimidinase
VGTDGPVMRNSLLITGGTLVTGTYSRKGDLLIADGKIAKSGILTPEEHPAGRTIDATGKFIFPGGIDPHVHLSLPTPAGKSSDDFISGSLAAIAGGTTCFIDFVTPVRGQSMTEALTLRRKEAAESKLDYSLHMGISEWNKDTASGIEHLIIREGIFSFKTYLAYRDSIGIDFGELNKVMEIVGPAGGIVLVHCEDGELISRLLREFIQSGKTGPAYHALSRPEEAETRAVTKVIEASARTGCPVYIVHTSTGTAAGIIRQAKQSGVRVLSETCPQYLLLDDSRYTGDNEENILPFIISPPLRKKENQDILWKGLSDGTVDVVSTDHCPFLLHGQKDQGRSDFTKIPNGAGGIEHRLTLLYTYGVQCNKIGLQKFVGLTSTRPAEIFGLGNSKGKLEPGFDADIAIWDPDIEETISVENHFQHCDSDIYQGFHVTGKPSHVIVNGKVFFEKGHFTDLSNIHGRFLKATTKF